MEGDKKPRINGKLGYIGFLVAVVAVVGFGIFSLVMNLNSETYSFDQNGYAVVLTGREDEMVETYSFTSGTEYSYKKFEDKVSFNSDGGNVKVDDTALIHYADGSLLALKNMVGMDLNTIDDEIILYYNIFKNTKIEHSNGAYAIETSNGQRVEFENLLLRLDNEKFLLASDNTRLALTDENVVNFGDYAYFEYDTGAVVKIYNGDEFYQTISGDAVMATSNITIDLEDELIRKNGKTYIALTNLVLDHNGNIDLITNNTIGDHDNISGSDVDTSGGTAGGGGTGGGTIIDDGGGTAGGGGGGTETIVDEENVSEIKYKVTKLALTALKAEITIEIEDKDALLTSGTAVRVVENATYSTVCEKNGELGDIKIELTCMNLKPDTEYTLYASASYKIEDIEYDKTFISKIFRTEALGVTLDEAYATTSSVAFEVEREAYSKVNSVAVSLYDKDGVSMGDEIVDFADSNTQEVVFDELENNTTYTAKMYDILSQGVIVDDGYSIVETASTLKNAPTVTGLEFEADKKNSVFNLNVGSISDTDKGIKGYVFEIYDTRYNINTTDPVLSVASDKYSNVSVNVDDISLMRGVTYTYRLRTIFNDGEKDVEYVNDLGQVMQIEGVEFPTVRWEGTYVTWEQINGTIVVNDEYNAVVDDTYTVIYKNSTDVHTTMTIRADAMTGNIPIAVNNLRKNETYTFQVYANINLQDGNPTIDNAYLGSVFVQTGEPQALRGNFNDVLDFSKAFDFKFNLSSLEGQNADLEASTLAGLTFSVYEGLDATTGRRVTYRKIEDTLDEEDYESSIKNDFYDNIEEITPAFFGMGDSDFTQKNYTLVVSYAYDYTDFQNEIPMVDNVYTFATSLYIPDYGDPEDAIKVTPILNGSAVKNGLEYNSELDATTTVGYSIAANFDNGSNFGRYVIYYVWKQNPSTGLYERMDDLTKTVSFDDNGNLPLVVYELGDGTDDGIDDIDMMRRGNTYRFSYEAYLDLDADELTLYPHVLNPDVTLYSKVLTALKQTPVFKIYPSVSTTDTMTWKYLYKDYDKAIYDKVNAIFTYNGQITKTTSKRDLADPDVYNSVTFDKMKNGSYGIGVQMRTKKRSTDYLALSMQYFPSPNGAPNLKYSVETTDSQVVISIENWQEHLADLDRVASADITFRPLGGAGVSSKTLANMIIDNGRIRVDFYDVAEFVSVDFAVDMKINYDTNIIGYDAAGADEYRILQASSVEGMQEYLCPSGSTLTKQSSAFGCMTKISLRLGTNNNDALTTTGIDNKTRSYAITIDGSGVSSGTTYGIVAKNLGVANLAYVAGEENRSRFDKIIPGISMLNAQNKVDITPLLVAAIVTPKIKYMDPAYIRDQLVYYDVMMTDKNGGNAVPYSNGTVSVANFGKSWTLTGLEPDSNFSMKFYVYVLDGDSYVKQYLYDTDYGIVGYNYRFYTLSDVGIKKVKLQLNSQSYYERTLDLSYTLDLVTGFDYIEYQIERLVDGEYVPTSINLPRSTSFSSTMTLSAGASPEEGQDIVWGDTYRVTITPWGSYMEDGVYHSVELGKVEQEIVLNEYEEPYIGLSAGKTDTSVYFRVSINDPDHVLYGDSYDIKVVDAETFTTIYTSTGASTSIKNRTFSLNEMTYGLVKGREYRAVLTLNYDPRNNGVDIETVNMNKGVVFGDMIDIGTMTVSRSSGEGVGALDFVFTNSYRLDYITSVNYNIVSATTGDFIDSANGVEFILRYNDAADFYSFTTNKIDNTSGLFTPGNVYLVTVNFYQGAQLVTQTEVTYYYE